MDIEFFSDMICPFCYIGKRRLESALTRMSGPTPITVTYRSFQLDPHAAREAGETLPERESRVHGLSRSAVAARLAMVTHMAADEGLDYHLDRALPVHTFDAHRLVRLASEFGKAGQMAENLMRAYAIEGLSIADHETLAMLATRVGLDRPLVLRSLRSDDYSDLVRSDLRRAADLGVRAVPTLIVNGNRMISGVEPVGVLTRELTALSNA